MWNIHILQFLKFMFSLRMHFLALKKIQSYHIIAQRTNSKKVLLCDSHWESSKNIWNPFEKSLWKKNPEKRLSEKSKNRPLNNDSLRKLFYDLIFVEYSQIS